LEKCMREHGLRQVFYSTWYTRFLPRCKIKISIKK
jgi:hypothetical protein